MIKWNNRLERIWVDKGTDTAEACKKNLEKQKEKKSNLQAVRQTFHLLNTKNDP